MHIDSWYIYNIKNNMLYKHTIVRIFCGLSLCIIFLSSMCMVCMWLHVYVHVIGRPKRWQEPHGPMSKYVGEDTKDQQGEQHWLPARWDLKHRTNSNILPTICGHHKLIYIFRWIRKTLSNEVQFLLISSCFFTLYLLVPDFAICVFARGMYTNMFVLNI